MILDIQKPSPHFPGKRNTKIFSFRASKDCLLLVVAVWAELTSHPQFCATFTHMYCTSMYMYMYVQLHPRKFHATYSIYMV